MKIITARPHRLLSECIGRIGSHAAAGEKSMFLVPSQYTLQAEIEIMTRLNLPGSFLIDVLSPTRLKSRVFECAGAPERVVFDERGKCMVLSAILEEEKECLTTYRSAAQGAGEGLAQKISAVIADFKRSGMSAQELSEKIKQMEENHPSKAKLTDVAHIYAAYESWMQNRLADKEDIARIVREKLKKSGVLEGQHVYVFGFDMITPAFAQDLMDMAAHAASLTLAIETDRNGAPDGRLFAPVNASIDRLMQLAKDSGICVEREDVKAELDVPVAIRALESSLFALRSRKYEGDIDCIALRAASTPRMEVHIAAATIRRMLADGEDPSDIAIVYPKGTGYAPLLENILPAYDLPVYVARKRAARAHPLCRFLLAALAVISGGWRTADVIEYIQSGFLGLTQQEMDALCAYAEGVDLQQDAWKQPLTYTKSGKQDELEALEQSRICVTKPLIRLQKALSNAKSADDTVTAVIELLEAVHAMDTLEQMRLELLEEGFSAQADDCAQVSERLMETLDQLHTLLGGEHVGAQVVLNLLTSGLSAMELAALPPADGAIICGEIGNIRTAQVKTLFAIGMNDSAGTEQSGLLTPQEAEEAARATGAYLGMSAAERAALAQLDTLKVLSGARERLVVSYSIADETGRALREGDAVQAMKRLYPGLQATGGLSAQELEMMLCAPKPAAQALGVLLSDAVDGKAILSEHAEQAYAALNREQEGSDRLLPITRKLGEAHREQLAPSQARALYGRPVMSVSRLEAFAQCPYRHFVRYGLAPQEELKPGVDRAQLGTLYHEAAERFTREITQLPEFPNIPQEICDRVMEEAAAPLIEAWRASPLGRSARGAAFAGKISQIARRTGRNIVSQFAGSGFAPLTSELIFGQNGVAPIMLELADGTVIYLQGRIDRVDVMDENRHIRVIDYKSGAKKVDSTMVYWGLQLQLLIYLAAALTQIPGSQAAGFFYCRIADPTIKSDSHLKEEIEKQIAKKLSLSGISLSDVAILRAQGESHAAMITKEGKANGRYASSMVDEAGMAQLVGFAKDKAMQLATDAYAGVIDDSPAERGQYVACASCDYAAVCGFDPSRQRRRRLKEKKLEDILMAD